MNLQMISTSDDHQLNVSEEQIATLRTRLRGRLIRLDQQTRGRIPALIAQCQGAADAITAAQFARENDLLVVMLRRSISSTYPTSK